ncbi:riboflavin synthase [Microvirga sp. W0021]|uniref:Riboflavin synthase n=1 Tax=Hohaiivirga grylli TaxID=3133970 RepID=A0ABV0BI51_9HYPH
MFTGLVSDVGTVVSVTESDKLRRIRIESAYDPSTILMGASIACSGPCLTVVAFGEQEGGCWFEVDAAAETLAKTTVNEWAVGRHLNLERSLKIGDELGGHIVTGHVDGVGQIVSRRMVTDADNPWGETAEFTIAVPKELARFIATKGSVCLDGTSLTVNSVDGNKLTVLLIPHTLTVTTWGERKEGDSINVEVDLMARYAARLTEKI